MRLYSDTKNMLTWNDYKWIRHPFYYQSMHEQRTPEWHELRKRITSRDVGIIMKHDSFGLIDDVLAKFMPDKYTPTKVDDYVVQCGIYGVENEPNARSFLETFIIKNIEMFPMIHTICSYSKHTPDLSIKEIGLAVKISHPSLGTSVDGIIYHGDCELDVCVEIKCPKKMYGPLSRYMDSNETYRLASDKSNFSHIWRSQYDQMQWHCHILNKSWCIYMVYCPLEESIFIQPIPYDPVYGRLLEEKCLHFIEEYKITPPIMPL